MITRPCRRLQAKPSAGATPRRLVTHALIAFATMAGAMGGAVPVASAEPGQTPTSIEIEAPAIPAKPSVPTASWDVGQFGAHPDDGKDDTQEIQEALDHAAASGGGTIQFSPGRYDISITQETSTLPRGPIAIELRSRVRLHGAETGETTLRLADDQGNYWAIFASDVTQQTDDVIVEGLTIDGNTAHNPVDSIDDFFPGDRVMSRFAIRMFGGERVLIDDCTFVNQKSRNVISLNANDKSAPEGAFITDATVSNSRFLNIGGGTWDFDHSTIYTRGDRMAIVGNTFQSTDGAGTNGVHTAIELHNNDQIVSGNRIDGYAKGLNVAATPVASNRILINNNTITHVGTGLLLWSRVIGAEPTTPGLSNLAIRDNRIQVDVDGWINSDVGVIPAGILTHGYRTSSPSIGVSITGNNISFVNYQDTVVNDGFKPDSYAGGIVLYWTEMRQPEVPQFRDVEISSNIVRDALTSGIWSDVALTNARITDNLVIHPGQNGELEKDYSRTGYRRYADEFRAGVYIDGSSAGGTASRDVHVVDNRTIGVHGRGVNTKFGVVANSDCATSCTLSGNELHPTGDAAEVADPTWNTDASTNGDVTTTSLTIDPPAAPAVPVIPAASVSVGSFGATPSDGVDDTAAIQAAIDSVSSTGGGTITFGDGVYDVSIDPVSSVAIVLRPTVRLTAVNRRMATIRLADNQGNYFAIFSNMLSPNGGVVLEDPVDDLAINGLVIDANSQNNPVASEGDFDGRRPRGTLRIVSGFRIAITDCAFVNQLGRQVIAPSGAQLGDITIAGNDVTGVGGNSFDFDHSSIYVNAVRVLVTDNHFASANGAGTNSVHTAIESHSADIEISSNTVDGYAKAMNIVSRGGRQANRILISGNTFADVGAGILLWSMYESAAGDPSLTNLAIEDNVISINADDWVASDVGVLLAGILTHGYRTPNEIHTVRVSDNEIEFTNTDQTVQDLTMARDSYAGGIVLWWDSVRQSVPTTITSAEITGNTVTNAISAGIWSNARLSDVDISGNAVVNPGRNGVLDKDYGSSGYHPYVDLFRSGVYIESGTLNTVADVSITNTTVSDIDSPVLTHFGVVAVGGCAGVCQVSTTSVTPTSITAVSVDPTEWAVV